MLAAGDQNLSARKRRGVFLILSSKCLTESSIRDLPESPIPVRFQGDSGCGCRPRASRPQTLAA
jgi:hypothetical protein